MRLPGVKRSDPATADPAEDAAEDSGAEQEAAGAEDSLEDGATADGDKPPLSKTLLKFTWILTSVILLGLMVWLWSQGDQIRLQRMRQIPEAITETTVKPPPPPPLPEVPISSGLIGPPSGLPSMPEVDVYGPSLPQAVPTVDPAAETTEEEMVAVPAITASGAAMLSPPLPQLQAQGTYGPLPIRAPDGLTPARAYAKPVQLIPAAPKVVIILTDLGLKNDITEKAITELPENITLSFSPFSNQLSQWTQKARESGHEFLLQLPMQPAGFPKVDPGPHALLTVLSADENMQNLHWLLGRTAGYPGVITQYGSEFTALEPLMGPVMEDLAKRGLYMVDAHTTARSVIPRLAGRYGLPVAVSSRAIDDTPDRDQIRARLREVELIAAQQGSAVALAHPWPVTLEILLEWSAGLAGRGLQLVPASALAATPATSAPKPNTSQPIPTGHHDGP